MFSAQTGTGAIARVARRTAERNLMASSNYCNSPNGTELPMNSDSAIFCFGEENMNSYDKNEMRKDGAI